MREEISLQINKDHPSYRRGFEDGLMARKEREAAGADVKDVLSDLKRKLSRMESAALERMQLETPGSGGTRTLERILALNKEAMTLTKWLEGRELGQW